MFHSQEQRCPNCDSTDVVIIHTAAIDAELLECHSCQRRYQIGDGPDEPQACCRFRSEPLDQDRYQTGSPSICDRLNQFVALINLCLHVKALAETKYFLDRIFCVRYRTVGDWHSYAPIIIAVEQSVRGRPPFITCFPIVGGTGSDSRDVTSVAVSLEKRNDEQLHSQLSSTDRNIFASYDCTALIPNGGNGIPVTGDSAKYLVEPSEVRLGLIASCLWASGFRRRG